MSADLPTLDEVVARGMFMAAYVVGDERVNDGLWERTSEMMRQDCLRDARAALATLREACTIRTAEQLAALPAAAVLIVRGSQPYFRHAVTASSLPALLIWHPDWAQS
ncbi:uncharacterized protein RMCC_1360 [Mycolicibacterium canariasense]|uniref:Uncharacterized protein n=1 Tax=Mycolicibacterium canariasense TaxID=228230 RepID=A0A100W9R7_MYCCR|nr:hypothetical protein [Mycolicibacterium canariasense]MCV7208818.1 hypothetical protein [Mycolicibacterium canariasense]ORV07117.1 hypothetical protein AWB94_14035 [Mycolicibacterium canariasense]GAS94394.1 uncharacterized protein RMCC_1360 [Mycolicibacterium canariasense]